MHVLFPVTYDCNLKCKNCFAKKNTPVDVEKALQNLEKKARVPGDVEWIYITGGEPFILPKLPDIIFRLKKAGYKVGVTTNGTVFWPEIADKVERIGISLDGDEEYHDAYRGTGTFQKALKLFNAIKDKCETVIMSVAFKDNQEALVRLKDVVEELDPTYWQIQKDYYNKELKIDERLLEHIS